MQVSICLGLQQPCENITNFTAIHRLNSEYIGYAVFQIKIKFFDELTNET